MQYINKSDTRSGKMKNTIKVFLIILMLGVSLTSCGLLGIETDREKKQQEEIAHLEKEVLEIKKEKEFIEDELKVFISLKELNNRSFIALENQANNLIIHEKARLEDAEELSKVKNIIRELPQNLVFEKTREEGETIIAIARSHRQRDDLVVSIEADRSSRKIKYINIIGSIETEEKTVDSLLLMTMVLEEVFPNRYEIPDYIESYTKGIENKMYKRNYELDGKIMEFRTSNNPKEKLYGHISLNIVY